MNCDNCGEEIGRTKIERPDGKVWCYKCIKTELRKPKKPKRTKSSDPFVKTARLLCDARYRDFGFSNMILTRYSKRIYTNGYVLMTELIETPEVYKLIDLDSLWKIQESDRIEYPDVKKILGKTDLEIMPMVIPEEFYGYAKAFSSPRSPSGEVRVKICKDSIWIRDYRDTSEMFWYDVKSVREADFDYRYFMIMKPKEIIVNDDKTPARILSSYNESVDACIAAVLMPMKDEE